jgi:DNA ligase 1
LDELAVACAEIARWNSRLRKVRILADYLRSIPQSDLSRAVRFLCCGPIEASSAGKFSIGGSTLREALRLASGWDKETLSDCHTQVGDTGETVALLMRGIAAGYPMSLAEADVLYARIFKQRRTVDKIELLRQIYLRHKPETLKFFVKVITGNLRIGLQAKMVEEAIAEATGASLEDVRAANNRMGDLARVSVAAREGTLHYIEARLFHPMEFMLAKPLDDVHQLPDPEGWWIEDKFDGFRAQVHVANGRVAIFTRGMEDATVSFPDLVDKFKAFPADAVIDGEVLAWQEGRPLPFAVLQQRIARKNVTSDLVTSIPVAFIAYDLLFHNGAMIITEPIESRRRILDSLPVTTAHQWHSASTSEIDEAFRAARVRGNEGLVVKRKGSQYEPGKRSGAWLKIKRPQGTLDVVITAAETGSGRRAVYLSDYTFAVRDGDRYSNIGKAYSGLTDDEVRALTRILRGIAKEKFGRVVLVEPQVVLEVAFDGIQKSPRHKSGYALRFPRILAWRRDKKPEQADTLERVKDMHDRFLEPLRW